MIFSAISVPPLSGGFEAWGEGGTAAGSAQLLFLLVTISFTNAQCRPAQDPSARSSTAAPSPGRPTRSPTPNRPISQAIATLEKEAGAPLIERNRGGARPTAAGAALAGHADGILAQIEAAEIEVAAVSAGHGGRLRTASFPTAGATLMPQAIAGFRASHPGVELTLAEDEPEAIAPRLRAGEFDLALLFEFEGDRRAARGRAAPLPALRRPPPPGAPRRPPAQLEAEPWRSRTCARRHGSRPRRRAPARATSSAPATPPASSRGSPSKATTTRSSWAWSRPASASPSSPIWRSRGPGTRSQIRELSPASPVRTGLRGDAPRAATVTPALATMLDVLREAARSRGRDEAT